MSLRYHGSRIWTQILYYYTAFTVFGQNYRIIVPYFPYLDTNLVCPRLLRVSPIHKCEVMRLVRVCDDQVCIYMTTLWLPWMHASLMGTSGDVPSNITGTKKRADMGT